MGATQAESLSDRKDILLVEYQKAQDSAEHHDRLLWTTAALILGGMAALFGLAIGRDAWRAQRWIVPLIGLLLCAALVFFPRTFRHIRKKKYDRCKVIERELGMEQHSQLQDDYPPAWIRGRLRIRQICVLRVVNLLFALGWVWLLYQAFSDR